MLTTPPFCQGDRGELWHLISAFSVLQSSLYSLNAFPKASFPLHFTVITYCSPDPKCLPLLICGISNWVQSVLWWQNTDPDLGSSRPAMLELLGGRLTRALPMLAKFEFAVNGLLRADRSLRWFETNTKQKEVKRSRSARFELACCQSKVWFGRHYKSEQHVRKPRV